MQGPTRRKVSGKGMPRERETGMGLMCLSNIVHGWGRLWVRELWGGSSAGRPYSPGVSLTSSLADVGCTWSLAPAGF